MNYSNSDLVTICTVQFEPVASIIKSHLESEGIPAYLRMESYGRLFGLNAVGLGQVSILVLRDHAEEAKRIIAPRDNEQDPGNVGGKNPVKSAMVAGLWGLVLLSGGR